MAEVPIEHLALGRVICFIPTPMSHILNTCHLYLLCSLLRVCHIHAVPLIPICFLTRVDISSLELGNFSKEFQALLPRTYKDALSFRDRFYYLAYWARLLFETNPSTVV